MLTHCDNQAVVKVINTGSCKDPELMQLLCSLFFITAHLEITLRAVHIPGLLNTGVDAIFQDNLISLTGTGRATLTHSSISSRNRPTDPPSPRLDVTQLVPVIQGLFTAGLAESTARPTRQVASATANSVGRPA